MSVNVFISHRHADEAIAAKIQEHVAAWIKDHGSVYRSSKPGSGRPGNDLENTVKQQIRETDLFILVYTMADEDWSWCMFELGIAAGKDTKPTTVVVFNCTNDRPKIRVSDLEVNARKSDSILNFVKPFHEESDWFVQDKATRDANSSLFDGLKYLGEETQQLRADELQIALASVLPNQNTSTRERLDHLSLTLDPAAVNDVRALRSQARDFLTEDPSKYEELRAQAKAMLLEKAIISTPFNKAAARRFGLQEFEANMNLQNAINNWRADFQRRHEAELEELQVKWIEELLAELSRATEGRSSDAPEFYMRSVDPEDLSRKQPVVVRTTMMPDGSLIYVINFFHVHKRTVESSEMAQTKAESGDQ